MNLFLIGLAAGTVLGALSCLLWRLWDQRPRKRGEIDDWNETSYQRPAPIVREIAVTRLTNRRRTVEL